jgi:hypothetical protein
MKHRITKFPYQKEFSVAQERRGNRRINKWYPDQYTGRSRDVEETAQ